MANISEKISGLVHQAPSRPPALWKYVYSQLSDIERWLDAGGTVRELAQEVDYSLSATHRALQKARAHTDKNDTTVNDEVNENE